MVRKDIFLVFFLLFFSLANVFSQPTLFDENPKNGTYIYGRDTDVFSIRAITDSIISASLFVKVKDPTAVWKEISMNCYNLNPWFCNATVPGLEALLAEGKYLLYYFKVSDSSGISYYGNESFPLEVLVDRSPPTISLAFGIVNNSYVSERKKLRFDINDSLSGVNVNATVFLFAYGNETWNSSWINLIYENGTFYAPWNTSELPNNSSWIVYINASDMVGNWNVTKIGIFYIDNENPTILDYYPKDEQAIWGEYRVYVNASDLYSGLNRIEISIGSFRDYSSCSKNFCEHIFNTGKLEDGNYTLNITVFDNAENFAQVSVKVRIDNSHPVLSLIYPSDYLSGVANLQLIVGNIREIKSSKYQIYQPGGMSESDLDCQNFVCNLTIDTKAYQDGRYTFVFKIYNEVGMEVSLSKTFFFDNTKPSLLASDPIYENGTIKFSFGGIDDFGLKNVSKIEFLGQTYDVKCRSLVEGKRILCDFAIEKELKPGNYSVNFNIYDLAGNEASEEKILSIKPIEYVAKIKENATEMPNVTLTKQKSKISTPFGEFELPQLLLIFSLPAGLLVLSIPLFSFFKRRKEVYVSFSAGNRLKEELSNLEMAERFLRLSGNMIEEKEYLLNVEKILESVSEISPLKQEFLNILKVLPETLKKKIEEDFGKDIFKLERRNVGEIKRRIEFCLKLNNLEEIKKEKEGIKILIQELKKNIEEEIELHKKINETIKGIKLER